MDGISRLSFDSLRLRIGAEGRGGWRRGSRARLQPDRSTVRPIGHPGDLGVFPMHALHVLPRLRAHAFGLLCLAALFAASSAPASSARGSACSLVDAPHASFAMRVPFDVIDGRIYVDAQVNGRGPFRFAIDTGASGHGRADASLVTALGLPIEAPTANSDGVTTQQVDTTTLASLALGGLVRRDVSVITRDYNSRMAPEAAFAGIIARGFFADGLLLIDYPRKTLSFSRALSIAPDQDGALAYDREFRIPVQIGDLRTEGNLDTGTNVAFVLPRAVFGQVGEAPLVQAGAGHLAHSRITMHRSTVRGPFLVGETRLEDVEVHVSEQFPEVLVGAFALQRFAVVIDQRSRRVAVCE